MGTNYYVQIDKCKHCGRFSEEFHIGKSSAGWCFTLHIIPEMSIHTLGDWKKFWRDKTIADEYGRQLTEDEMLNIIINRSWDCGEDEIPYRYKSWDDFHRLNDSEFGPNGLLRYKIGSFCTGHGEGTWDYVKGDFS